MDLGFNLAQTNRDLKDPTSRQNFGDTSGLLCNCKNDQILRRIVYNSWFELDFFTVPISLIHGYIARYI